MKFLTGQRPSPLLIITAVFAFLWAVARAAVQAVTIDEADTYLAFVHPPAALQWYPAANNHVLNTLLMRLFTFVFGLSHLTLRAPALIGAFIYISAALWLASIIAQDLKVQWPLLACLIFNPFVFDYLVAARGYGLALAFLMCAVAVPIYFIRSDRPALACALGSACAGLSVAANFSFAFVNAAAILIIFLGAARKRNIKLIPASILPALLVTVAH